MSPARSNVSGSISRPPCSEDVGRFVASVNQDLYYSH
jgi:hypothetical protein